MSPDDALDRILEAVHRVRPKGASMASSHEGIVGWLR